MEDNNMEYKPVIPAVVRTATYYAGVAAGAAGFIFIDEQWVARAALAIGFIAASFGVAYRPTRNK